MINPNWKIVFFFIIGSIPIWFILVMGAIERYHNNQNKKEEIEKQKRKRAQTVEKEYQRVKEQYFEDRLNA